MCERENQIMTPLKSYDKALKQWIHLLNYHPVNQSISTLLNCYTHYIAVQHKTETQTPDSTKQNH